jgi:hypothetical protein
MKLKNASSNPTVVDFSGNFSPCQIGYIPQMSTGRAEAEHLPIGLRLKLLLNHQTRQYFRKKYNSLVYMINRITGKGKKSKHVSVDFPVLRLKAREMVRVRAWDEIQKTLDSRNDFKGCGFMLAMKQYCGTTQRVLKPVEIFIDERDLRLHKSSGVVLLDGLICEGDERFGRCDRSCFFFWREEWLERTG